MRLADIQARFKQRLLTHPDTDTRDMGLEMIMDVGEIDFDHRFSVYCDNYINGLSNILGAVFPAVKALVGDEFMNGLSHAFIKDHLPQSGNLNQYGESFPDFIASCEQTATVPYLTDVARLEWAKNVAYHAADDSVIDLAKLELLSDEEQERIVFYLRSSCILLQSEWPLLAILDFVKGQGESDDMQLDLDKGADYVMIYRPKHEVQLVSLEPSSFKCLKLIQDGLNLSQVVETILQFDPNFDLVTFLQTHYKLETFSDFTVL